MDKGAETAPVSRPGMHLAKIAFIVFSVLVGLYFVAGVLSLAFPESGIPFVWVAFPIGPQSPPVQ
jgi:hypothetical protein